ncbi:hypothetical protein NDU88_004597 [Pleurodeles waltl]|uniref:Uncharacterized protein n=1 Tax=Pleurodeles waltl TaxID=8319 RepID=A0AAV7SJ84_PLEWA|nr:hypothetical protein NDU88_004597 [Pleurodeles waltl]
MRGSISHFLGGVTVTGRCCRKRTRHVPKEWIPLPLPTRKWNIHQPIPVYVRGTRGRGSPFAPSPGFKTVKAQMRAVQTSGEHGAGERRRKTEMTRKAVGCSRRTIQQETLPTTERPEPAAREAASASSGHAWAKAWPLQARGLHK